MTREAPHHNATTCYTDYNCRLADCVERYNTLNAARLRAHRDGTWSQRYADAEPVRQHLIALAAAGIGYGSVAAAAGLSVQSVRDFLTPRPASNRGRKQRTSPEFAAKILAINAESHIGGRLPNTGTKRRIEALVAAGWPLRTIAQQAGLAGPYMSRLLRREVIFASTSTAVAEAYDRISKKSPLRHGVTTAQCKKARNWGAREGWPPPKYWAKFPDAIDDPHFTPEYGMTKADLLAEEAAFLVTVAGLTRSQAAVRLGKDKSYVDRVLKPLSMGVAA